MESSPPGKCILHNSKKRVFPESYSYPESNEEASSSDANRNLKGKNKMHKRNEDDMVSILSLKELKSHNNEGIIISPTLNGKNYIDLSSDDDHDSGMEFSNPRFLDSVKINSSTGFVDSTPPEHVMISPSMVCLRTWLDRANRKHKGVKPSFHPAKFAKGIAGSSSFTCPSLRIQKGEMKVRSVKKQQVKSRLPKIMEDVVMEEDSGDKYPNFKKFDIVEDYSDHHYKGANSESMQPPRNWSKRIQKEWKILEKDLPDTIFVRVYESRMDLLRAVIIGAEGTPYHDGLFFFDVFFPHNYPLVPPKVYYHSGGLRINPNLYRDGKVCLSLLNTWIGDKNENWRPGVSTMLQVLVSIQGLILNSKPYFNEPGYADSSGSNYGESQSMLYNERTFIYSLKTMGYTMKNPPKHFEDLVIGHFREHAVAILTICRGYINGVGVGCGEEIKGSNGFGKNVEGYMGTLVGAFKGIGVENVDEFVPQTRNLAQKIRAFFGI